MDTPFSVPPLLLERSCIPAITARARGSELHLWRQLLAGILLFFFCVSLMGAEAKDPEPSSPEHDGTLPALSAIAGQGMMQSHAYQDLEELCDQIGGRITGSPQAAQAVQWGITKMRALGLQNVRAEQWQLRRGWTRVSATAELVSPVHRNLTVESMGWTG